MNRTSKSAFACIVIAAAILTALPEKRKAEEALPALRDTGSKVPAAQSSAARTANDSSSKSSETDAVGRAPITHKQLTVSFDGKPLELTLDAMETSGGTLLLDSYSNGVSIHPWPGHATKVIAEAGINLYTIDLVTTRMDKLLEDENGIYKLQEVEKDTLEDSASPIWGGSATVSPDGRTLIYYSNRNAAYDRNYDGFLWRKNLDTGEECALLPGGYSVLGWGLKDELFIRRFDRITEVDTSRGTETEIAPSSLIAAVSYPYLINQEALGKLTITYLVTGETASYSYPGLNAIRQIYPSPYGSWAVLVNQVQADASDETIDLINLYTGETRHIFQDTKSAACVRWTAPDAFIVYEEPNHEADDEGRLVQLQALLDKPALPMHN
ncbi:hypothetical protein GZH47_17720 [Paenibacillus rhizovicinus]|uniref:WD40 repeat domain-containing protein n=1 Tax=Paenibacillus rhizovicinus TaxID=2704463 RepID=A0A6C0P2H1_9BACL|nr:PD40 domain-containing protein [Paenibacillus rhizovicinus]QHW32466.1 hypothetical protein GZH47_17720 [Paenibacillus rhizovicinus]